MSEPLWIDEKVGPDAWKLIADLQKTFKITTGLTEFVWCSYPKDFTDERDSMDATRGREEPPAADAAD